MTCIFIIMSERYARKSNTLYSTVPLTKSHQLCGVNCRSESDAIHAAGSASKSQPLDSVNMHARNSSLKHISDFTQPRRRVTTFDCNKILNGDQTEIEASRTHEHSHRRHHMTNDETVQAFRDCHDLQSRGYILGPSTDEERDFPLAFSIIMHHQPEQTEKLLRLIYRPHNVYCIHVDKKAPEAVKDAVTLLSNCFNNVFVATTLVDVIYEGFSRMEAELNCMSDALKHPVKWKYYINLVNEVFPLKTNLEMTRILKVFNGTNDIEGLPQIPSRYEHHYEVATRPGGSKFIRSTDIRKPKPPHGISIVKGSAYGSFSRAFVEYVLTNQTVRDFIEWSRDTLTPDEHIWSTLHHIGINPQLKTPGGFPGPIRSSPWISVFAVWGGGDLPCLSGRFVHGVCIQGLANVHELVDRPQLFANKFKLGTDDLAWDCMEEWYFNKTSSQETRLNLDYYRNITGAW